MADARIWVTWGMTSTLRWAYLTGLKDYIGASMWYSRLPGVWHRRSDDPLRVTWDMASKRR
jgi:hypothetical protein